MTTMTISLDDLMAAEREKVDLEGKSLLATSILGVFDAVPAGVARQLDHFVVESKDDEARTKGASEVFRALAGETDGSALSEDVQDALNTMEFTATSPEAAKEAGVRLTEAVSVLLAEMTDDDYGLLTLLELRDPDPFTAGKVLLTLLGAVPATRFPQVNDALRDILLDKARTQHNGHRTRESRELLSIPTWMESLDVIEALYDDPALVAQYALAEPGKVSSDELLPRLADAPALWTATWLYGLENAKPDPDLIRQVAQSSTPERVEEIAKEFNRFLDTEDDRAHGTGEAWWPDVMRHLFLFDANLTAAAAATVAVDLRENLGTDASAWEDLVRKLSDPARETIRMGEL